MPLSNWLHHIAVRGCLILALTLVLSSEGRAQSNSPAPAQQAQPQQQSAPTPAPVPDWAKAESDTDYYKYSCDRPKQREDADLCEQRRMAKAAEDSVWWAALQTTLGILGFLAVVLSLVFTGWAAIAAAHAAEAAQASVKVASQTAERELRAYVSVDLVNFDISKVAGAFACRMILKYKNTGQTPAYRFAAAYRFKIMPWPLPDKYKIDWPDKSAASAEGTINPQTPSEGSALQIVKIDPAALRVAQERLYLIGAVTFVDAFKRDRGIRFCGSIENAAELAELAASSDGKSRSAAIPTTFNWTYQENDDPDPS
jgi:hypothetical protein